MSPQLRWGDKKWRDIQRVTDELIILKICENDGMGEIGLVSLISGRKRRYQNGLLMGC